MTLQDTPQSNRLHIALFGRRNSGKSSLVNALTGQEAALVSETPGTTTDPVYKAMEIYGIGPCVFIDTPGYDDEGELGQKRIAQTLKAVEKTDVALLLCQPDMQQERRWIQLLAEKDIPFIPVLNKADLLAETATAADAIEQACGQRPLVVSALERQGMDDIRNAIREHLPEEYDRITITGNQVEAGDLVLLVMPQDIQAPKGRLILPQVQTLRELLDKRCLVMSCTTDRLQASLEALARPPKLIITDSQVFKTVYELKPAESRLTSFSVLFAAYKGDIRYYREGASAIDRLQETSRVLIAEACTHAPLSEDIGRVKLPRMLRQRVGEGLQVDVVAGGDFPEDLSAYTLVIQCGGCMINRKQMMSRIEQAKRQGVAMTNYGVAMGYLLGVGV